MAPHPCVWCNKDKANCIMPIPGSMYPLHLCASCESLIARQLAEARMKGTKPSPRLVQLGLM